MLLVPLVLSTVPETICSKFLQMKDQNVLKHHQARTKTESLSADPHLATTLEGRLVGNRSKQPQLVVNQLDATHKEFIQCSLAQYVWGINMPIIRSTI